MLALSGLVVVGLLVAGTVILGLDVGRSRGTETPNEVNPDGTTINALQVRIGTCLEDIPEDGAVARVVAVPCSVPHRAEVVSSHQIQGDSWPGRDAVVSEVLDHCGSFIQPGFGADSMFQTGDWENGLRWVAWIPTEESWGMDQRSGQCVVYRGGDIVGSFAAGTATFTD